MSIFEKLSLCFLVYIGFMLFYRSVSRYAITRYIKEQNIKTGQEMRRRQEEYTNLYISSIGQNCLNSDPSTQIKIEIVEDKP